ncbi:hypothetical protein O181_040692 [Austropuccinia psidii MF-1]|uniref:Transposase Tc1-like domain-containing protein n=1 Tax=Austropuccinia psidii MF-1 TaxID=1389203 RepID=A0A9Q3DFB4_9BASI|nr:hypothetical protein [Austropuccinia psidii MF-1]
MPPYCTPVDCGQIIGMHDAGASIQTIAQFLGIPPTTVHDKIRRFKERGHLKNLPIPGPPKILDDRDLQELVHVVKKNRHETLVSIKNLIMVDVLVNTFFKMIHELGRRSCIAVEKPYLSPQHMQHQLEFAHAHLHWS